MPEAMKVDKEAARALGAVILGSWREPWKRKEGIKMPEPMSEKRLQTLQAGFEQAKPQYYLDSLQLIAEVRWLKAENAKLKEQEVL